MLVSRLSEVVPLCEGLVMGSRGAETRLGPLCWTVLGMALGDQALRKTSASHIARGGSHPPVWGLWGLVALSMGSEVDERLPSEQG